MTQRRSAVTWGRRGCWETGGAGRGGGGAGETPGCGQRRRREGGGGGGNAEGHGAGGQAQDRKPGRDQRTDSRAAPEAWPRFSGPRALTRSGVGPAGLTLCSPQVLTACRAFLLAARIPSKVSAGAQVPPADARTHAPCAHALTNTCTHHTRTCTHHTCTIHGMVQPTPTYTCAHIHTCTTHMLVLPTRGSRAEGPITFLGGRRGQIKGPDSILLSAGG